MDVIDALTEALEDALSLWETYVKATKHPIMKRERQDRANIIRQHIADLRDGKLVRREDVEALTAERDRLAGIVRGWHWLAVGPDEMGDYLHQRELIKASEPYASPAHMAIAAGAHASDNPKGSVCVVTVKHGSGGSGGPGGAGGVEHVSADDLDRPAGAHASEGEG